MTQTVDRWEGRLLCMRRELRGTGRRWRDTGPDGPVESLVSMNPDAACGRSFPCAGTEKGTSENR